jgi:hypothetical protein
MQTPNSPKPYNPNPSQYLILPSAPPDDNDDDYKAASVPIDEELKELQYRVPSAPPYDYKAASAPIITDEELKQLQYRVYDLNIALVASELEYLNGQLKRLQNEIAQMDITKCDEQCKQANNSIESNAIDAFLEKEINNIFNK